MRIYDFTVCLWFQESFFTKKDHLLSGLSFNHFVKCHLFVLGLKASPSARLRALTPFLVRTQHRVDVYTTSITSVVGHYYAVHGNLIFL